MLCEWFKNLWIAGNNNGKSLCEIEETIHRKWHRCYLYGTIVVHERRTAEKSECIVIDTAPKSDNNLQEGLLQLHYNDHWVEIIAVLRLQENFVSKQAIPSKKHLSDENGSNDLNLTGSPLRDTCNIDYIDDSMDQSLGWTYFWAEEDETYRPIPFIRAQYVRTAAINWILFRRRNSLNVNFIFQTNSERDHHGSRGSW